MLLNKLVSFNENKNSDILTADSILNLENVKFNFCFVALPGSAAEEKIRHLPLSSDKKIHILSEPKENTMTETDLHEYIENYRRYIENTIDINNMVHMVLNDKWFALFKPIIQEYDITVVMTKKQQFNIEFENTESILNVQQYLSVENLIHYSNSINNNILIDLRGAFNEKLHYKLNFEKLISSLSEFNFIDILINENSYLPNILQDNITVYKESTFTKEAFQKTSYVYFYSNKPYDTDDVEDLLFYAANSKVVYTNYNFHINNILPSVIMNLDKNDYTISKLPDREAFDIINENRNTVMYNFTFLNVLNSITENKFNKQYVSTLNISGALENFEGNIYFGIERIQSKIKSSIMDFKYDIEKMLMFPILFLGYSRSIYNESEIDADVSDLTLEIPYFNTSDYSENGEKLLSMIVPIHNNGKYLKYKCFNSILSLTSLDSLEIIFIDDGSSDKETLRIINDLILNYPFIKYKRYENGSGSASRPRNSGMAMSTCKYITFLDPDNEAISDGYSILLDVMENERDLDMVVGNIVREDNTRRNDISYFKKLKNVQQSQCIDDSKAVLIATNLGVQSIQALVVKKSIIDNNHLTMIEGAAGQDTLFFQELLLKCEKSKVINHNIHSYYAYVEGSVTNTVSHKFFEKFYKVEIERIKFLEQESLIEFYMERRFNSYMKSWYLKKFNQIINTKEKALAKETILKILDLYSDYRDYYEPELIDFSNS